MTFSEITQEITSRLNLTSSESITRVGRLVNRYHQRVTTAIGVAPISRRIFNITAQGTVGSAEFTFGGMENITRVWYLDTNDVKQRLDGPVTLDELRDETPTTSDTPSRWALVQLDASEVTIVVDTEAETDYYLYADGYGQATVLSGTDEPAFPESFHDILVEGVLKDEYKKMEKVDLAKESRNEYEQRLSDLRMWGAKQAYLKIQQSGRPRSRSIVRDNQGTP